MPKPKKNEAKQDFLNRCTKELVEKEDRKPDVAYAMCNGFWDNSQGQRSILTLAAPLELKKDDGKDGKRPFLITAYTGQPLDRFWGTWIIDLKGMKAKNKIPALREHERNRVVGHTNKSWHDKDNFYLAGNMSNKTKDAIEVVDLADEGFPWQASMRIRPIKVEFLENEKVSAKVNGQEIKGPADIWRESLVGEISFVALGVDDETAAIVLSDQEQKVPVNIELITNKEEVNPMDLQQLETEEPELLTEIREMARTEVTIENFKDEVGKLQAGATDSERTRILGVFTEVYGKDPAEKFSKVIDPEASMADMMGFAQEKAKLDILAQMKKNAPESLGPGSEEEKKDPLAGLTGDEKLKKEYELSADLQAEFGGVDRYVSFSNAEADGKVKIFRVKTA